ncbi:MAG: NTP transferase domain-containing protein [Flammeovirgaceae bacterium]
MDNISIVVLAAGSSSRLGQSKQLVKYHGQSLLQRTVSIACATASQVAVVLGSNYHIHHQEIAHQQVYIVNNVEWQNGMGHSLKTGVKEILKKWPHTTSIMVLVCDQPTLTQTHLQNMVDFSAKSPMGITCSSYQNTLGVPAIFKKEMFQTLLTVADEQGAKKLILTNSYSVDTVEFVGGEIDIDTPEDLRRLC